MAIPGLAGNPPVVPQASAGTATAQKGFRNSDMMGVSNEMVVNDGMGFGNGMNFTGDMDLNHARGHRSPEVSFMGDAARKTRSTSSSISSVSHGASRTYESRRGTTAFNPGTYSSGVIDQEIDQGAASITSQRPHIKSENSASSFRSRNDLGRSDFNAMNTTAGPSAPVVYPQITGNLGTPVGFNSAFMAPSVFGPHSNHILPMDDNRTRTPNGRETPQHYRGFSAPPSFQEAPNFMVDHAPQKLVPSSRAARDHGSLVRQCTYLTETHNPRPVRANARIVDWEKRGAIEVSVDVVRAEIPLILTSNQDLGAALDDLLSLDDAVAGSLISDCETLLTNHTPAAEGSLSTADEYKLSKLRVSTQAKSHSTLEC